jgi:DNA-binding protein HU-beta
MNRTELTAAVAEHVGGDVATARRYLDAAIETIARRVAGGERVIITGFGTFERAARAARTARNPRTGQPIVVGATNVARFTVGQTFKSMVASSHTVPAAATKTAGATKTAAAAAPKKAAAKGGKGKHARPGPDAPVSSAAAAAVKGKHAKPDKATAKVKPASKAAAKAAPKKSGAKKAGKAGSTKAR